jgi:acetoin utilization deacetylase AcuC-like enzyme
MLLSLVNVSVLCQNNRPQLQGWIPMSKNAVTGIFYHPSFSRRSYLTQGARLEAFPQILEPLLEKSSYRLYESPLIDEESILKVHTRELLDGVRKDPLCSTAWHSAGGVAAAACKIAQGEIENGFVFIGAGGHHSGRDFFGGFCCFNDVVIAIHILRENYGIRRIAILDTDAHHGDGARDLIENDPDVLHVCLCSTDYESCDGAKVDVSVSGLSNENMDAAYAAIAGNAFIPRARSFRPDFIFWYFGFDTHVGDYGDLGLTLDCYMEIVAMVKNIAYELCQGRVEVVLGGGSRSDIAQGVIPPVIKVLGEQ